MTPDLRIPPDVYAHIEREIESDASPVGIDARKAHVLILHKLLEIEKRLDEIERRLESGMMYNR